MKRTLFLLPFLLGTAFACVGGKSQISSEEKARLAAYILDAAPADATKVDINFENKIHLVGYKVEPAFAPPGTNVKVTYYWRCDEPVEDGWQLFTHLQHEGFDRPDNLDGNGPLREVKNKVQVLGPDRWERGKVYADEQTFTMPAELRGPESFVYVGIYKGDARLRIISGPSDGDNRAIVAKIKTGVVPMAKKEDKRADVPRLEAMKLAAGEKIVIDGKGDDKAWGAAASTGPFVDVGSGKPNMGPLTGAAKLAWDDEAMYALIEVKDPDLVGYFTDKASQEKDWTDGGQPKLWEKECAEIMIDPDGDGDNVNYYELQFNPQGKAFKSWFETLQKPNGGPNGPFGHEDWDPKAKLKVVAKGTIDDPSDKDEGYTVELAIPWRAFEKGAASRPPKPGDGWRMNFYAMKGNGGPSWSPILGKGNFHHAPRFGRVAWVTKEFLAARAADAGALEVGASDGGTRGLADAGAKDGGAPSGGDGGVKLGGFPHRRPMSPVGLPPAPAPTD